MSNFKITSGLLANTGCKGKLPVDENGYYRVILGAVNVHNSMGQFYTGANVVEMFGKHSCVSRRIEGGGLYIEVDHPSRLPGQSLNDYFDRLFTIEMKNVCGHVSKIEIDENFGVNHPEYGNPNIIAIVGWVKPFGPYKEMLQEAIDNPLMNLAFSVRGVTADMELPSGLVEREFTHVNNWDYVPEPGIKYATRRNAPGLESFRPELLDSIIKDHSEIIDKDKLKTFLQEKREDISLESGEREYFTSVLESIAKREKKQPKKNSLYDLVSR